MYFIKKNKTRCILMIFMLFLGYGAYLGGLYVTNPYDNWRLNIDYYKNMVSVSCITSDEDMKDFQAYVDEVLEDGKTKVIPLGADNGLNWHSVMGFDMGRCSFTFCSIEDFKDFCSFNNIECDFNSVKNGSIIMSEKFALNLDLKLGDKVDKDYDKNIYGEFSIDAITKEDGYTLYYIDESEEFELILLLGTEIKNAKLYDYAFGLQEKYDVFVYQGLYDNISSQLSMFNTIYVFVVILMAVIMAVTINAAFVGMYQHRTYEFAVYRAIGISKRRIVGKIAGELLCMDLIALTAGGAVFFTTLYLFNNLVLYPVGKYLKYYHPIALLGIVVCNLMVIVPLITTRCKKLLKADICEY